MATTDFVRSRHGDGGKPLVTLTSLKMRTTASVFHPSVSSSSVLCSLLLLLSLVIYDVAVSAQNLADRPCWLQEVHYNNFLTDRNEFLEIACRETDSPTGWTVHLYQNLFGREYASYSLDANNVMFFDTREGLHLYVLSGILIRVGGAAILDETGSVQEFTSWGGSFIALDGAARGFISADTDVREGIFARDSNSLQLIGSGCEPDDFLWDGPIRATMGTLNLGQASACTPQPSAFPTNSPTLSIAPSQLPSVAPSSCSMKCHHSCTDALLEPCGTTSDLYEICPLGPNGNRTTVYCDQETGGGGWMLLHSYRHINGQNIPLVPGTPPLTPTRGYSHFFVQDIEGYSLDDIEAVRFYCRTSNHGRIVHFINTSPIVRSAAWDGNQTNNVPEVWVNSSTMLPDHDGILPQATDSVDTGGEDGFQNFPFFNLDNFHWAIRGAGFRWECDDLTLDGSKNTLHTVYVRMFGQATSRVPSAAPTACEDLVCYHSCAHALATGCEVASGLLQICPAGIRGPKTTVYCDQEDAGGGWMLTYAYNHTGGENETLVSNTIPLDPLGGYSHFYIDKIAGYSESDIEAVRFYCQTSSHNRTMHFYTTNPFVFGLAWNGDQSENTPSAWIENTVTLVNETASGLFGTHNANLPLSTNNVDRRTDGGYFTFPFYTSGLYHWAIRGGGNRWECDDFTDDPDETTLHIVWVRMKWTPFY